MVRFNHLHLDDLQSFLMQYIESLSYIRVRHTDHGHIHRVWLSNIHGETMVMMKSKLYLLYKN